MASIEGIVETTFGFGLAIFVRRVVGYLIYSAPASAADDIGL